MVLRPRASEGLAAAETILLSEGRAVAAIESDRAAPATPRRVLERVAALSAVRATFAFIVIFVLVRKRSLRGGLVCLDDGDIVERKEKERKGNGTCGLEESSLYGQANERTGK